MGLINLISNSQAFSYLIANIVFDRKLVKRRNKRKKKKMGIKNIIFFDKTNQFSFTLHVRKNFRNERKNVEV